MAVLSTTRPHPFSENPISPGTGNVLNDDGPYTLRSRVGEVAVIALCGIYNENTDTFTPRFMGVHRGLFIVDGQNYTVDLDCNIEMNQTLTIKAVNPPFTSSGPDRFIFTPYLSFGSEGYFGGSQPADRSFRLGPLNITGTSDTLTGHGFAPLTGELAGLDYYVVGGAYDGADAGLPESITVLDSIRDLDHVIVLPEFMPVAQLTTPHDGGELVERYLEWQLATTARPDFYSLLLVDYAALLMGQVIIYWDVRVPGDQNAVNLPFFPDDAQTGIFPAATMLLDILSVRAVSFDYDNFDDYNNFSLFNWQAWSENAFLVTNPF
jgi:hypothetical protein